MFIGREQELKSLQRLKSKSVASLFVCKGRRRIGKSSLIKEFSKSFSRFWEFQGLSPRKGQTNDDQLAHFSRQLAEQSNFPEVIFKDWSQAFQALASQLSVEPTLILFDEISWMGKHDKDFPGKLKIAWDTKFSEFNNLLMAICGSVSSWIEENILHDTNFVGRISSTITLRELPLQDCAKFWSVEPKSAYVSTFEKVLFLSVTGGVPRYLEELIPSIPFEQNLRDLCFKEDGFLFNEMERIFDDSFDSSRSIYRELVLALSERHGSLSEIASRLDRSPGGSLNSSLEQLEQSGFVAKDSFWKIEEKKARRSRYRLCDNYLRFYLRLIKPNKERIIQGVTKGLGLGDLPAWRAILGYQFENLIYNNLSLVVESLELESQEILSLSPFLQKKSSRVQNGCQIDLLIHSRFDTLYVCEMKCKRKIGKETFNEMAAKVSVLKRPKYLSLRPVLIYAGELDDEVPWGDLFFRCIDVGGVFEEVSP